MTYNILIQKIEKNIILIKLKIVLFSETKTIELKSQKRVKGNLFRSFIHNKFPLIEIFLSSFKSKNSFDCYRTIKQLSCSNLKNFTAKTSCYIFVIHNKKNKIMNKWIKQNRLIIAGIILGAIGGFIYYKLVGCASGTCPITSSPLYSTIWGAGIGGLVFSLFPSKKKEQQ